jgi:hypothetical protein
MTIHSGAKMNNTITQQNYRCWFLLSIVVCVFSSAFRFVIYRCMMGFCFFSHRRTKRTSQQLRHWKSITMRRLRGKKVQTSVAACFWSTPEERKSRFACSVFKAWKLNFTPHASLEGSKRENKNESESAAIIVRFHQHHNGSLNWYKLCVSCGRSTFYLLLKSI